MSQNICEYIREQSVRRLFTLRSFSNVWTSWRNEMLNYLPDINETNVINLGDHLSDIFRSTTTGRNQSTVSGGGTVWEALVCWYLNLCLIGTRGVVIKHNRDLIPEPIRKSIVVNYGNFPSNTESDLVAIIFPDRPEYTILDKMEINVFNSSGNQVNVTTAQGRYRYKEVINTLSERDFTEIEVGIIQCKTNWNDNAQIPMLWDMVYSAGGFRRNNISIGMDGYSIQHLRQFTYSFVTVPTSRGPFRPTSTSVKRVSYLSGGNYWGKPSMTGVARSIKEIFNNNFSNCSNRPLRITLRNNLNNLNTVYSYFRL